VKKVAKKAAKKTAKTVAKKTATTPAGKSAKSPQSAPYGEGKWAHVFTRRDGERRYWLVKSEPGVYSFDDLLKAPKQTTHWDNIRNSTARNFLRDGMKKGDLAFFYHSNAEPSAIVGICEIVGEGYPDAGAFDPANEYYDPKSNPDAPTWFMVDVHAVEKLPREVTLPEIKADAALSQMALVKQGRLSVSPVTAKEWEHILAIARKR
jgi:predicted RNA-binding protein with PUA-like domain